MLVHLSYFLTTHCKMPYYLETFKCIFVIHRGRFRRPCTNHTDTYDSTLRAALFVKYQLSLVTLNAVLYTDNYPAKVIQSFIRSYDVTSDTMGSHKPVESCSINLE